MFDSAQFFVHLHIPDTVSEALEISTPHVMMIVYEWVYPGQTPPSEECPQDSHGGLSTIGLAESNGVYFGEWSGFGYSITVENGAVSANGDLFTASVTADGSSWSNSIQGNISLPVTESPF